MPKKSKQPPNSESIGINPDWLPRTPPDPNKPKEFAKIMAAMREPKATPVAPPIFRAKALIGKRRRLRPRQPGADYTVTELAHEWGLSTDKIRELFRNEPGVKKFQDDKAGKKRKRRYTTLRIGFRISGERRVNQFAVMLGHRAAEKLSQQPFGAEFCYVGLRQIVRQTVGAVIDFVDHRLALWERRRNLCPTCFLTLR